MPASLDDIDVATFVSQAEKCISDNGGGKMPGDILSQFHDNCCWGCGSKDHVWWNKVTQSSDCEKDDVPSVNSRSAKTRIEFVAARKKKDSTTKCKSRVGGKKGGRGGK